ncbi:hypothetical protein [Amycolatopsis sp. cmx-8-4]|uniref:hypothetical protein n=1 Tax=Amycolatopsis sp. cmx-8-4 TaxID=2790947 RepID=UPI00397B8CAF
MLISAGFGSEIATTVLWLTTTDNLDITCARLVPHRVEDRPLLISAGGVLTGDDLVEWFSGKFADTKKPPNLELLSR